MKTKKVGFSKLLRIKAQRKKILGNQNALMNDFCFLPMLGGARVFLGFASNMRKITLCLFQQEVNWRNSYQKKVSKVPKTFELHKYLEFKEKTDDKIVGPELKSNL